MQFEYKYTFIVYTKATDFYNIFEIYRNFLPTPNNIRPQGYPYGRNGSVFLLPCDAVLATTFYKSVPHSLVNYDGRCSAAFIRFRSNASTFPSPVKSAANSNAEPAANELW